MQLKPPEPLAWPQPSTVKQQALELTDQARAAQAGGKTKSAPVTSRPDDARFLPEASGAHCWFQSLPESLSHVATASRPLRLVPEPEESLSHVATASRPLRLGPELLEQRGPAPSGSRTEQRWPLQAL